MKKKASAKSGKTVKSTSGAFTLGRQHFAKISEVEGIKLSGAMKQRAAELDRRGSSAEERRMTIIRTYRKD
jgi:hypothetical protein